MTNKSKADPDLRPNVRPDLRPDLRQEQVTLLRAETTVRALAEKGPEHVTSEDAAALRGMVDRLARAGEAAMAKLGADALKRPAAASVAAVAALASLSAAAAHAREAGAPDAAASQSLAQSMIDAATSLANTHAAFEAAAAAKDAVFRITGGDDKQWAALVRAVSSALGI